MRGRSIFPAVLAAWLFLLTISTCHAQAQTATDADPSADACRPVTDRAMAADMQAATAQAQRKPPAELARLYGAAIGLWEQASAQCQGRPRDRALRNLADSRQAAAAVSGLIDAGSECTASQKDADALQELARQASADRRWSEATLLYRKAESRWDVATERCSGEQQRVAQTRREAAGTDAFNTEYCAPLFDRARVLLQRLRSAASPTPEEKHRLSMLAETGWRDAIPQCRGAALDLARSNATALARERGTAWVALREGPAPLVAAPAPVRIAAATSSAPADEAASAAAAVATTPRATAVTIAPLAAAPLPPLAPLPEAALPPNPAPPQWATSPQMPTPTSAARAAPLQPQSMPADFTAGTTRFHGSFVSDVGAKSFSGTGQLTWQNGDRFDGTLVKGLREGKGKFVWANGQSYDGDWANDSPSGRGLLVFTNGNRYEGEVSGGLPNGHGRMQYASGDLYTGRLVNGNPEGQGVYVWINGQRFEGNWVAGVPQGRGKMRFANGNQYEGAIKDGLPHGTGTLVFATGDRYTGTLAGGNPDGEGHYVWVSGDQYVGRFKAGVKEGPGTLSWANGDRWEGTYRADEQHDGNLIRKGEDAGPALAVKR